jgi:hypothetical protein
MNSKERTTVYITSLVDVNNSLLKSLLENYSKKEDSSIALVEDPKGANFIVLAETGYLGWPHLATTYKFCNNLKDKYVLMINNTDWPYPVLDGFYPSLTTRCSGAFSWGYYLEQSSRFYIERSQTYRPKYLYSFVGRVSTHGVRQKLMALDRVGCPCVDVDNISDRRFGNFEYHKTYYDIIHDSYFVLCPRGFGASSIRLFEVMRAGRVPVIISDKWIAPPVGDWNSFSIKIEENDILYIPAILRKYEHKADELGKLAKQTYNKYFRSDIYLESIIDFYSKRARRLSRNTLVRRAFLHSSIRELRSIVKELT